MSGSRVHGGFDGEEGAATLLGSTAPASFACTARAKRWRCGIYVRLSVRDNARQDQESMVSQLDIVRGALSALPDVDECGVYEDNGFTGTSFQHRPAFARLLGDLRSGVLDCVACKDLSRFGRNYLEAGAYLDRMFPQMGVRFIAVSDGIDTARGMSDASRIVVPVKNLVNEMHSRDISVKERAAKLARMSEGVLGISLAPFGYCKDPANPSRLVVDPEAALVVREVLASLAAGEGTRAIARRLNRKGAPTPARWRALRLQGTIMGQINDGGQEAGGSGCWTDRMVAALADNPHYGGDLVQNQREQSIFAPRRGWRALDERIVHKSVHEALASGQDLAAVRLRRDQARRDAAEALARTADARALLPDLLRGGRVRCAQCGHRMEFRRQMVQGASRGAVYECSAWSKRRDCTGPHRVAAELVWMLAADEVRRLLGQGQAAWADDGSDWLRDLFGIDDDPKEPVGDADDFATLLDAWVGRVMVYVRPWASKVGEGDEKGVRVEVTLRTEGGAA